MKSKEFIKESEIDDAIAQAQTPTTRQPGVIQRSAQAFGQGMAPKGVAGAIRSATNVVQNTTGTSAPRQTGFWTGDKQDQDSRPRQQSKNLSPTAAQELKQLAGGHVAKTSTGDEEIDRLLKSAGLMK